MAGLWHDIYAHRELLQILVLRNLKIRYKNSVLGFFWTLLNPVLLIAIYAVFLGILRVPIQLPVLITGIIVWQFLAMCMGDSLHAILGNANLVKKTPFPRLILPLSTVAANLVNFLLSLVVLFGYLLFVGPRFSGLAWLPAILLTHFALCVGMSLLFSAANVFFRDTEHILQLLLLAWFFLTPVIYPLATAESVMLERFPAVVRHLYFANPMTGIVTAYRAALLGTELPALRLLLLSAATAWAALAAGLAVFQSTQKRFADEL